MTISSGHVWPGWWQICTRPGSKFFVTTTIFDIFCHYTNLRHKKIIPIFDILMRQSSKFLASRCTHTHAFGRFAPSGLSLSPNHSNISCTRPSISLRPHGARIRTHSGERKNVEDCRSDKKFRRLV